MDNLFLVVIGLQFYTLSAIARGAKGDEEKAWLPYFVMGTVVLLVSMARILLK